MNLPDTVRVGRASSARSTPAQTLVTPDDAHNRALVANVHPNDWVNPNPADRYNLVVIGAGTAGLVSAIGAASLGAKVAIVEKHLSGGDCLNFGCVPSKAVLSAARALETARGSVAFGVRVGSVELDFGAAMERMRRLRAQISGNDSVQRLSSFGIDVFLGEASFVSARAVQVDGRRLNFKKAVLATGTRPAIPAIPGLADVGFLTNETVFSLTRLPQKLIVIGGGPIGCELAQAFRRFGSEVAILARGPCLLPREDKDVSGLLHRKFQAEGVWIEPNAKIIRIERRGVTKVVVFERSGAEEEMEGDEILVATGRRPNTEDLGLQAAGIDFGDQGVTVDQRLCTSNRHVYAAGDVGSSNRFTHAADALARIAVQNALFLGRKRAGALVIPWCTYTDPEVAHVGLNDREARERGLMTYTVPLAEVDRAILDGQNDGLARIHVEKRSGRIAGATMVAPHAGEMIGEIALAMTANVPIGTLARTIHPYPTQAEAWKKLGDAWNRSRLTPGWKRLLEYFFHLVR